MRRPCDELGSTVKIDAARDVRPAAGAAGRSESVASGDVRRCGYFAIQVAMRAEVLSRWSAQNAESLMK